MLEELKAWAAGRGRLAVLDAAAVVEAGRGVAHRLGAGELDEGFYRRCLAALVASALRPGGRWRSLILLSCPRPAHRVVFERKGEPFACLLPPTYVEHRRFAGRLLDDLRSAFGRRLPRTAVLRGPLKLLAVASGLAAYGRNNVTYSGDYGSYHQLAAFASEAPLAPYCQDGPAGEVLPSCARCSACARRCPTGAIDPGRFLLRAERCFTLLSEYPGRLPPVQARMAGEAPCLVGCLACQTCCPADKGRLKIEPAPVSFTAAETERILRNHDGRGLPDKGTDPVWRSVGAKMRVMGMVCYQNRIGRNLRFMMEAAGVK